MQTQLELSTLKRQWVDDAANRIAYVAHILGRFTTDDIHKIVPAPAHPNWFGVLMAKLKNKGIVRRVDVVTSKRPSANGRLVSVWEANKI